MCILPEVYTRAIREFDGVGNNSFYTIIEIERWLNKHESTHSDTTKYRDNLREKVAKQNDGLIISSLIGICEKDTPQLSFIKLYESLNEIYSIHKYETYLKNQLIEFHETDDLEGNKRWLIKNKKIGVDDLLCFNLDYVNSDRGCVSINPKSYSMDIRVDISLSEFESTINFLGLFNELYWENNLLEEDLD
jgi:hypothetical protein